MTSLNKQKRVVQEYFELSNPRLTEFLDDALDKLPDFGELKDIAVASEVIVKAMAEGKRIALYGDYDADGTTSIAVFYHFLKMVGCEPVTYQPSRFIEGYGLHSSIIEKAKDEGVDLMITFDCGITNYESAQRAQEIKLPLIITDHHSTGELELPCALAVVNPNRKDQPESDLKKLAGVGVSFALAVEVRKLLISQKIKEDCPSIYSLLQFVAIGTIGDMVSLCPMNAKLVRHGLRQFSSSTFASIKAFMAYKGEGVVDSSFIGFDIAPMINAEGRLDTPEKSLKLLLSEDLTEATSILSEMKSRNEERKKIQRTAEVIATNKIKKHGLDNNEVIVIYHDKIHQGVVGLVASFVVKNYKRPCIVLTNDFKDEDILKGSARSYGDFDLLNFLKGLDFPFINFGGHKKAGGMSFHKKDLELFNEKIKESSKGLTIEAPPEFLIELDSELLDLNLVKIIDSYGPFGEGNPRPLVATRVNSTGHAVLKGEHVKFFLRGVKGSLIYFNFLRGGDAHIPKGILLIKASPTANYYNGNVSLSLIGYSVQKVSGLEDVDVKKEARFAPENIEF